MIKIIYICIIISVVVGCNTKRNVESSGNLKSITIDTEQGEHAIDVSGLFEENIEIIKLETNDDCLLTTKGTQKFTKDFIFIADEISQKIAMFDWNGKYLKSFGKAGRGPGEFIRVGDFTIMNDSIYVQDAQQDKIIIYPVGNGEFREVYTDPPIFYSGLVSSDNHLYFITNHSFSGDNYNQLIRMDIKDGTRKYFIPYDKEINQKSQSWGLNKYAGEYQDSILLIYARNDTIYNLSNDHVFPQYLMNFIHNRLPENLLQKTGTEILMRAMDEGYNRGLRKIYNTRDYLMGCFGEGKKSYDLIYAKKDGKILLGESLISKDLGELPMNDYSTTDADEFIAIYDAAFFIEIWEYILKVNDFKMAENKEKIRKIAESLHDDENPVIIKTKFKQVP